MVFIFVVVVIVVVIVVVRRLYNNNLADSVYLAKISGFVVDDNNNYNCF